ncbi:hypothetical protein GGH94_004573 [Coemansia aciculifera]|uniref:SCP domain-containing protein n=1 Tax=Coemansia aciculifera TaxID=417176 RepID=A0A9W8INZ4_9FUNG|nr:hypothetical protein GGH94_004573 [Coemansia aciculifera]
MYIYYTLLFFTASVVTAVVSSDTQYDLLYSLYTMRQLQGSDVKALWSSDAANASAQALAMIINAVHFEQSALPVAIDVGSSQALVSFGSDITSALQLWSSDSASTKAIIQPKYTTTGLGNSGQYWVLVLSTN